MAKYRKIPVVIDAFQFTEFAEIPDWAKVDEVTYYKTLSYTLDNGMNIHGLHLVNGEDRFIPPFHQAQINTLEGTMTAQLNDWIIKGVNGEIYPCKPDIFEKTYELVEDD